MRLDAVGQLGPRAGDAGDVGLAAESPFRTDLTGHPGHFGRHCAQLGDHGIDGRGPVEVLALQRSAFYGARDSLGEIAVGDRFDDTCDFHGGLHHVIDEGVDRVHTARPAAVGTTEFSAVGGLSFFSDIKADPVDLDGET